MSRRNRLCRLRNPKANVIRILYRSLQGTPFERPAAGRRSQAAGRRPRTVAANHSSWVEPLRRLRRQLPFTGEPLATNNAKRPVTK